MERQPDWDGNIDTAREGEKYGSPKETYDGNREYPNGTYGQNEYTVREIGGGKLAVFIKSDSDRKHSHDVIDEEGNLIESYHDFVIMNLYYEPMLYGTEEECIEAAARVLQQSSDKKILTKRRF